jgi:hypothetical protein
MKIVLVEWNDCCSHNNHQWMTDDEVGEQVTHGNGFPATSVAILVSQTKDKVVLAGDRCATCCKWGHVQEVPIGCIKRIRELRCVEIKSSK